MNISEHTNTFIQEMKRRNYSRNTIENYSSCISKFFSDSKKDHPKNINENDIKEYLGKFLEVNTQRNYHAAIKKFYDICLGQKYFLLQATINQSLTYNNKKNIKIY